MHVTENDPDGQARLTAFVERLKELQAGPKVATCAWIKVAVNLGVNPHLSPESLTDDAAGFHSGPGSTVVWPLVASAQQPKMLRVGYSGIMPREASHYSAFEKRMAELGYQQGRNFAFEYIQAPSIEGYQQTYGELAARRVDMMPAAGNEPALRAARAARAAAGATLIVFIALYFDPVEKGYVASLSRPGNNITGIFVSQLELAGKRVELLRETFPNARRVGVLWDAASREQAVAAVAASKKLDFEARLLELIGEPPRLCRGADAHG